MSQPAMSNALRRFRATMNDPLFIRRQNGVAPTKKADELAPIIHATLDTLRNVLTPPGKYDFASDSSVFRLAMEELSEIVLIPSLVRKLSKIAPGLRLSVSPHMGEDAQNEMRFGRIDLSIDYTAQRATQHFDSVHLFDEDRVCVLRASHPDISDTISMERYRNTPHVALNQHTRGVTSVNTFLADQGIRRQLAIQVPGYHAVPLILESTDFIATMPRRVARHFANTYPLRFVELPFSMPPLLFYLKWHKSKTDDARHRWLRNLIIDLFVTNNID